MNALLIILGLAAIVVLFVIMVYNSLIVLRTRVEEAWADIEVQDRKSVV